MRWRFCAVLAVLAMAQGAPAMAGVRLSAAQQAVLDVWLAGHPALRQAVEEDCLCDDTIEEVRLDGAPGLTPYIQTGDFRGNGSESFAVVVTDKAASARRTGTLLIFDAPFTPGTAPALETDFGVLGQSGLLPSQGGPLAAGHFYTRGCEVNPQGATYVKNCNNAR